MRVGLRNQRRTAQQASADHQRRMNEDNRYNGWTNRETWLVILWIQNERDSHFLWRDRTHQLYKSSGRTEAIEKLADELQTWCDEHEPQMKHGMFADLLTAAMDRVNWHEIACSMVEDCEGELSDPLLIFSYTRAQAIADGVLVDASTLAQEAGFKYPVALTSAAWADCVTVPEGADGQDETGRLWDVLNVLRFTIQGQSGGSNQSEVRFTVSVRTGATTSEDVQLKSLCGPGDNAEPVITIMLPHED